MHIGALRIATRKSPLAIWQAEHVAERLRQAHPGLWIELVGMVTGGDKILDSPLSKVGGKGLFVKELEQSLLENRADLAVHSMKDVPVDFPTGLGLPVMLAREDPRDAFVSRYYSHPDALPADARVGTSSLRRQCQLAARYPHWQIRSLRGNVGSRLDRLDSGEFDAILLAAAGLKRLGLKDTQTQQIITTLDDAATQIRVAAERAFNARLQGGCQTPIAGHALLDNDQLWLRGLVGEPDGSQIVAGEIRGLVTDAETLGATLADELLERGADVILGRVFCDIPSRMHHVALPE